uniref:Zinc finger AN1 and C2H2 domain-containing stress-associated protein 16 n=2 Tax=Auxenochlorella protothecoides TaxID=3075 RepID=A0A1D2ACU5_AUXPR
MPSPEWQLYLVMCIKITGQGDVCLSWSFLDLHYSNHHVKLWWLRDRHAQVGMISRKYLEFPNYLATSNKFIIPCRTRGSSGMAVGDADEADLLSVGTHCAFPDCNQLDFLPFTCKHCRGVFCLEHRSQAQHECARRDAEPGTLVCPVCALAIRPRPGESPDAAFEKHASSGACDPSNYSKVHHKPRCPAPRCRERLTSVSAFTCKDCGTTVCLAHRLPSDHACTSLAAPGGSRAQGRSSAGAVAAAAAQSRVAAAFSNLFSGSTARGTPAKGQGRRRQQLPSQGEAARPSSSTAGVPASAWEPHATPRSSQAGSQPRAPPSSANEECPACGDCFADVGQLIAHAEVAHRDSWASGARLLREACPLCELRFHDPVQLVEHVERSHSGGRPQQREPEAVCVLS